MDEKFNRAESIKVEIENTGAIVEEENNQLSSLMSEVHGLQRDLCEIKIRSTETFESDLEQEMRQIYPDMFASDSDDEYGEDIYLKYRHLNEK